METEKKYLTFRELLERNTNLLTVLGIFNALSIYSQSIEEMGKYLSFSFLILSMFVLWEVIRDFQKHYATLKNIIFGMTLLGCQFGFFVIVIFLFYNEFQIFISWCLSFIIMLFLIAIITHLFKIDSYEKSIKFYIVLILLLGVAIFGLWLPKKIIYVLDIIQPYIKELK